MPTSFKTQSHVHYCSRRCHTLISCPHCSRRCHTFTTVQDAFTHSPHVHAVQAAITRSSLSKTQSHVHYYSRRGHTFVTVQGAVTHSSHVHTVQTELGKEPPDNRLDSETVPPTPRQTYLLAVDVCGLISISRLCLVTQIDHTRRRS